VPDFFDLSGAVPFDTDNAYDHMRRKTGREVADYLVDGFTSTYQFHHARTILHFDLALSCFFGGG